MKYPGNCLIMKLASLSFSTNHDLLMFRMFRALNSSTRCHGAPLRCPPQPHGALHRRGSRCNGVLLPADRHALRQRCANGAG